MRKSSMAILGVAALLAGCATGGGGAPVTARLSPVRLVVTLSDGQVCTSRRPDTGDWAGEFADCGPGVAYRVTLDPARNPLREAFEKALVLTGLEGTIVPLAQVSVTDAAGRAYLFTSPEPFDH